MPGSSLKVLSDVVVYSKYAKYIEHLKRRETWEEIVTRNKTMHQEKFPTLFDEIEQAYKFVYDKKVVPSLRSMQFAGKPIKVNPVRNFNCSLVAMDDWRAFPELMFLLLSGVGVGISVQKHHVEKLPPVRKPLKRKKRFLVGDSIEGWSDAVKVLLKSYFYNQSEIEFDYSDVRSKGSRLVTSGGKAPGPQPLKDCIHNIRKILDGVEAGQKLRPIEVHDLCCYVADAVLAGGIRRSALISFFSLDDEEMLTSKFGKWYEINPQRARANNSAVILRHRVTEEDFKGLWEKIKASGSGEPGIFYTNSKEVLSNPCGEVALSPLQLCNLTEVNFSSVVNQSDFEERCKAASFIGTLQATYTNFHYLRDSWKRNCDKEALLGVSLTGLARRDYEKFDFKAAAKVVKDENARAAALLGINCAARCCTIKPSGTASLVLSTSSGIHAWFDRYYIRRLRFMKNEPIARYFSENIPNLLEDDFEKPSLGTILSLPIKAPEEAIFSNEESALDLLKRVKHAHTNWIKPGHRKGDNTHNVSVTVYIKEDEWNVVGQWLWDNRTHYTGISILPYNGSTYVQMPLEKCSEDKYNELTKFVKSVDLKNVIEEEDLVHHQAELACAGGACEIK